jgi:hypothetical protein
VVKNYAYGQGLKYRFDYSQKNEAEISSSSTTTRRDNKIRFHDHPKNTGYVTDTAVTALPTSPIKNTAVTALPTLLITLLTNPEL